MTPIQVFFNSLHLQPAAKYLGYKEGDFPVAENHGKTVITFPAHPYLTEQEIQYTIDTVTNFYKKGLYTKSPLCHTEVEAV